ncbi:MAG: hypothetical protein EHM23_14455 [Acidobacteria bacterium]|nr:MAG: hypothetical protein EHM23_14455 [Acidobacteriota bacterium]
MRVPADGRARFAERIALLLVMVSLIPGLASGAITYPQIAVGGGCETVLTITNPADRDWIGRLHFLVGNDQDFPITLHANGEAIDAGAPWTVRAKSTVRYVITGDQQLRNGYLKIERTSGPEEWELATSLFYRLRDTSGKTTDLVGTYAATASKRAVFPIDRSPTSDTGIALLPSAGAFDPITFSLIGTDGATIQEVERIPTGHEAIMAGQLFSKLPTTFLGSVIVSSAQPIHLLVLRLEISGASIQLTGTAPLPISPPIKTSARALSFRVVDAEYSKTLDRIIAVAADPHRLHIYDPLSGSSEHIGLVAMPRSVSVSPDGEHAVVGHNSWLSYINLVTRKAEKIIPITVNPNQLILADNGFVYLLQPYLLTCVRISTGEEVTWNRDGGFGALHPSGRALYLSGSQVIRVEIINGLPGESQWSFSEEGYRAEGQIWGSEDGERLFSETGAVLRSSEIRSLDMRASGTLGVRVTHLAHSLQTGQVAIIPDSPETYYDLAGDTQLELFQYDGLQPSRTVYLPSFPSDEGIASHGRFVFFNRDGTRLFVIVQADPKAGLIKDYGVFVLEAEELQ